MDFLARIHIDLFKSRPLKLLLVRVDSIGDYVLFRNFIKEIRNSEKYKNYKIAFCGNIVLKDFAETFERGYIDEFIWIDRRKFVDRDTLNYRYTILRSIARAKYKIAIQLTYRREALYGDSVVRAASAEVAIGSVGDELDPTFSDWKRWDRYYTSLIPTSKLTKFEFEWNREFFSNVLQKDLTNVQLSLRTNTPISKNLGQNYCVLFPGAASEFRRWDPICFAEIGVFIVTNYDIEVVIAGGPEDTYLGELIEKYLCDRRLACKNIVGQTTLPELVSVIEYASLIVTNDTSAAHIGSATGTPTICISSGFHYDRFTEYPMYLFNEIRYVYPPSVYSNLEKLTKQEMGSYYSSRFENIDLVSTHVVIDAIKDFRSRKIF